MEKRLLTNDEMLEYISLSEGCPYCDASNLEVGYGDLISESKGFYRVCECDDCGARWIQGFEFTHMREIPQ